MKKSVFLISLIMLLVFTACGDDFDVDAERETLESLTQELFHAAELQDQVEMDRYLAAEFSVHFGNRDFRGAAGRGAWVNPAMVEGAITVIDRTWRITPQMAVARSHESWVMRGEEQREFLLTVVWEKIDGEWKVVHVHMSELDT
jgi:hypothetical protein